MFSNKGLFLSIDTKDKSSYLNVPDSTSSESSESSNSFTPSINSISSSYQSSPSSKFQSFNNTLSLSSNNNYEDDDNFDNYLKNVIIKDTLKGKQSIIKEIINSIENEFKIVNINEKKDEKIEIINNVINNINDDNIKHLKKMYEITNNGGESQFVIRSSTYSHIDGDKYTKMYNVISNYDLSDLRNLDNNSKLFYSVLYFLMNNEYEYHKKAYDLLKETNTINGMIENIKNTKIENCDITITGEPEYVDSCNKQFDKIKKMEFVSDDDKFVSDDDNYTVVVPEIYDSNMTDKTFYIDNDNGGIYYYITMNKIKTVNENNMLQNVKNCINLKKIIPIIDTFFMIHGISHNDLATKGNVFVDEEKKIIYIIDFGAASNYVYNANEYFQSPNITSLIFKCKGESKKSKQSEGGHKTLKRNKRNKNKQSKSIKIKSKKSNNKRKNSHKTKKMKK
jgi:hypothetical protein